jgi:molybdate transport system substrate-binding protein
VKALWLAAAALYLSSSLAGEAHVAVAANFAAPARELAQAFAGKVILSTGSTGKLYAQIRNGAPFDVLLAADEETPRRLEAQKLAAPGSRFTYAVGRLALFSPRSSTVGEELLRRQEFQRLAIANPKLAPYGAAAKQTLEKLGLWSALQGKLVQGENIAQTFQFVASGNADAGLVAAAQVKGEKASWIVPERYHAPLAQDAVLLARGAENETARAFLAFLKSAPARQRIRSYGYE